MSLPDAAGNPHVIAEALQRGPVLLGIYKSSCQASKTMFPFLERLHQRFAETLLTVLGVSQDSPNITRSFARRYGVTFPILVEPEGYPVSNAFAIAATPTAYVIRSDGTIAYTTMGFFKNPINELGHVVATELGAEPADIFTAEDTDVPIFVPG
jgi:peroxiredoxin